MGEALGEGRVGCEVFSQQRDAPIGDPLRKSLQQPLPSQNVTAAGTDQRHGKGIGLQFAVPGIGATQRWPSDPCQPSTHGSLPGELSQQQGQNGVPDDPIDGVPQNDVRHFVTEDEGDLVPLTLALLQHR